MKDEFNKPHWLKSQLLTETIATDLEIVRRMDPAIEIVRQAQLLSEPFEGIRQIHEENERQIRELRQHLNAYAAAEQATSDAYLERFRLPQSDEIAKLISDAMNGPALAFARIQQEHQQQFQSLLESIRRPFLQFESMAASVAAVSELHGIGWVLNKADSFDNQWVEALRVSLGDWREPVDLTRWDRADASERSELYAERGLDPELTDFPEAAFIEILDRTGIAPPELSIVLPSSVDEPAVDDQVGPVPMRVAYGWLFQLERDFRQLIDRIMPQKFGAKWLLQRAPKQISEHCKRRQEEARLTGQPARTLIEYFDFGHYEQIVSRKDNWDDVFGAIFGNRESFLESMHRLYPVRNSVMHARPLSQEDVLLLFVEVRRLSKAIRRFVL